MSDNESNSDYVSNPFYGLSPEQADELGAQLELAAKVLRQNVLEEGQAEFERDFSKGFKTDTNPDEVFSLSAELENLQGQPMTRDNKKRRHQISQRLKQLSKSAAERKAVEKARLKKERNEALIKQVKDAYES